MEHKIIKRWKYLHSMDCYLYENKCSCGKVSGGWSEEDAEKDFENHKEDSQNAGEKKDE